MVLRAFLGFSRFVALVAMCGIAYAAYAMHLSPGMCIGLCVVWFVVFGALF
jgi:hypothetical protein